MKERRLEIPVYKQNQQSTMLDINNNTKIWPAKFKNHRNDWLQKRGISQKDGKIFLQNYSWKNQIICQTSLPVKSKDGVMLTSSEEQKRRWVVLFKEVSNQPNPRSLLNLSNKTRSNKLNVYLGNISESKIKAEVKTQTETNKLSGEDQISYE